MPSALKARRGRPSVAEMRSQLDALRKPPARKLADIFDIYYKQCQAEGKREIVVKEPGMNWKALIMSLPPPQNVEVLGCGIRKILGLNHSHPRNVCIL